MPTDLGLKYKPSWRGNYAGMLHEDYPVWERWLDKNEGWFNEIYYNVRIGGPDFKNTKLSLDPEYAKIWYDLNAKRIDALGVTDNEVWIIEVTSRPGLRAIGQLATYLALWMDDPVIKKLPRAVLIADFLDPDLAKMLKYYGMFSFQNG